jgi:phosphosulfolactate synthase
MYNSVFSNIPIDKRGGKPRESGLTVIIDRGLGVQEEEDFLDLEADYIDLAKFYVGIAALIDPHIVRAKIDLYHQYGVSAFPGGMFLEYAVSKGKEREYLSDVIKAGFAWVEVSDNNIDISSDRKCSLIKMASQEYGLRVLGEVGSKKKSSDVNKLIGDVKDCLEYGAWKVMFEAAELFENGRFKREIAEAISQELDIAKVIFELPGPWIPKIVSSDIYSLQAWLVDNVGPGVNIANVEVYEVLGLEAERTNLGTRMKV